MINEKTDLVEYLHLNGLTDEFVNEYEKRIDIDIKNNNAYKRMIRKEKIYKIFNFEKI